MALNYISFVFLFHKMIAVLNKIFPYEICWGGGGGFKAVRKILVISNKGFDSYEEL